MKRLLATFAILFSVSAAADEVIFQSKDDNFAVTKGGLFKTTCDLRVGSAHDNAASFHVTAKNKTTVRASFSFIDQAPDIALIKTDKHGPIAQTYGKKVKTTPDVLNQIKSSDVVVVYAKFPTPHLDKKFIESSVTITDSQNVEAVNAFYDCMATL